GNEQPGHRGKVGREPAYAAGGGRLPGAHRVAGYRAEHDPKGNLMKKEIIDVPGISKHLKKEGIPLSAAVRAGGFVFVSGQPPVDRRSGKIPLVNVKQQTRMVLDNIKACLEAAGSSMD